MLSTCQTTKSPSCRVSQCNSIVIAGYSLMYNQSHFVSFRFISVSIPGFITCPLEATKVIAGVATRVAKFQLHKGSSDNQAHSPNHPGSSQGINTLNCKLSKSNHKLSLYFRLRCSSALKLKRGILTSLHAARIKEFKENWAMGSARVSAATGNSASSGDSSTKDAVSTRSISMELETMLEKQAITVVQPGPPKSTSRWRAFTW